MSDELMSTDERIQAIFDAADLLRQAQWMTDKEYGQREMSDAIDAAMSHAYAEGRADERREWEAEALKERTLRAMNEPGEHGGLVSAIENIWGLAPKGAKRAA